MFENGNLMSFQQLQQKYNLPAHDFFKYLQLKHYFHEHKDWNTLQRPPSNMEQFFLSVLKGNITTRYISHIYKILQEEVTEDTKYIKGKLDLEINMIIKFDDWEQMFWEGHKISNSPTFREFEWKTKARFFRTPFVTSKFGRTTDKCWSGCRRSYPYILGLSKIIKLLERCTK